MYRAIKNSCVKYNTKERLSNKCHNASQNLINKIFHYRHLFIKYIKISHKMLNKGYEKEVKIFTDVGFLERARIVAALCHRWRTQLLSE